MSQPVSHSGTGSGSDSASSSSYTSQNGITQTENVSKSEIEIASESVAKNKSESVSESASSGMSNQSNQSSQPAESESKSGSNHSLIQYPPGYESMHPQRQQQFNAALARGDVILTNGVASNPVLSINGELPQRYRVTEQGLMECDGVFAPPSLYRQALILDFELYPPYNVHPHAVPRLIHLLRSRVVELCSPDLPIASPVVIGDYDDTVTADEFESRRRFQLRSCLRALQLLEQPEPVLRCNLTDWLRKLEVRGNQVSDDVMAASLAKTTIDHSLTPIADLVRPRYDMVEILNGPSTRYEGEYDIENACEECDKIATVNSIRVSFGHPPLEYQYCQLHDPSLIGIDDDGDDDESDEGEGDEGGDDDEDDEVE